VWELQHGQIEMYRGNYTDYLFNATIGANIS
jgi:hypothetical protein